MRVLSLPLLLSLAALGCSSDDPKTLTPDEYVLDCESVTGGAAFASDENWDAFINAEAANKVVKDACLAPDISAAASLATLDPDAPPTISFAAMPAACTAALAVPAAAARACRVVRRSPSFADRLVSLVEGTAQAHCGAFTGENYVVRLEHAGETRPVYLALLSVTSYTPDAAIWKRVLDSRRGQTLALTIERGVFFRGDISEGPFVQPTPISVTVKP